jgi:primosomal protein N'
MIISMFVVSVIPIARGIPLDELSYFSPSEVSLGALVSVPIRGKKTKAIVVDIIPAQQAKADIKSLNWSLKKIDQFHAKEYFDPAFMHAVRETAKFHSASIGATLHAIYPEAMYKLPRDIEQRPVPEQRYHEELLFQDEDKERLSAYKSLIREEFAKNSSVFFVLPSQQDIEHVYESLERGIKDYTFVFHAGLSQKELKLRWTELLNLDHPALIIGTAYFLSLPRNDIGAIILDRESANAYKGQARPFIDMRYFARLFAKELRARIIYGDIFLRIETLYRFEQREIQPFARPKFRIVSTGMNKVVDMQKLGEQPATGKIAICSPELVDTIEENRKRGTHLFFLGVRRGCATISTDGHWSISATDAEDK